MNGESREATHDLLAPLPLATRAAKLQAKAEALIGADAVARLSGLVTENAAPGEIGAALQELQAPG